MAEIFLSYRRGDSLSVTGRLTDKLTQHFGAEQVFHDLEAIEAGDNFAVKILESVRAATVVLVIIGPDWLDMHHPDGTRRLDNPQDYLRREIETAFENNLTLIPVLVEQAAMPSADRLPDTIKELALQQAHELSDKRWVYDTDQLIVLLEQKLGIEPIDPPAPQVPVQTPSSSNLLETAFHLVFTHYISTLISLIVQPKKSITARNLGRKKDFSDALTFFYVTISLATLLAVSLLPTEKTYWSAVVIMPFFLIGLTLVLTLPLYASWRLAGIGPQYKRIAIPFFYQIAILALWLHIILGLHAFVINLYDARLGDRAPGYSAGPWRCGPEV